MPVVKTQKVMVLIVKNSAKTRQRAITIFNCFTTFVSKMKNIRPEFSNEFAHEMVTFGIV